MVGWLVVCLLLLHQLSIPTLLNLLIAKTACLIDFVIREATFEIDHFTVTLKSKDVGTDTVEEPTIMTDDYRTTGECLKTFLQGTECVYVDVVGRLIEEEDVAFLLQCHSQLKAIALTT